MKAKRKKSSISVKSQKSTVVASMAEDDDGGDGSDVFDAEEALNGDLNPDGGDLEDPADDDEDEDSEPEEDDPMAGKTSHIPTTLCVC